MRKLFGRVMHRLFIAILWRTIGKGPAYLSTGDQVKVIGITCEETPAGWLFYIGCAERGFEAGVSPTGAHAKFKRVHKIDFRQFKKVKGRWIQQTESA